MPEPTAPPPPPTQNPSPQPMAAPTVPQDSLLGAAAGARSRIDSTDWQTVPGGDTPAGTPTSDSFAAGLSAMQAKDKANRDVQSQSPAVTVPPAQPATPSTLEWKKKQSSDWNALKARAEKAEQELAQLRNGTQSTANSATPAAGVPADFEAIRKERDELLHARHLYDAANDPQFKSRYDVPREAALKQATQYAGNARDEIVKILGLPPGDTRDMLLEAATKDFKDSAKAAISAANQRLIQLDVDRQIELETRAKTWNERQAAAAASTQQRTEKQLADMRRTFDRVTAKWRDPEGGMPFVLPSADKDDHAKALHARAENYAFGRMQSEEELAEVAWKAAVFDDVIKWSAAVAEEATKYQEAYERIAGAQPESSGARFQSPGEAWSAQQPQPQAAPPGRPGQSFQQPRNGFSIPLLEGIAGYDQALEAARRADIARGAVPGR